VEVEPLQAFIGLNAGFVGEPDGILSHSHLSMENGEGARGFEYR
jgi:hypothetical protein